MKFAFTFWLALVAIPALADQAGRALMDKAEEHAASAPALRRVDTSVQFIAGLSLDKQRPQTNVVTIEIDRSKQLARQTTMLEGKELIILRQGEKAAMKLGAGPWKIPTGPFETMAKDIGNLFVCEMETPETKENAPNWKIMGTELLDGQEVLIVETEGKVPGQSPPDKLKNSK